MPTAPPAADLFSLKKSCKIEQEVVIFVGYSRHSGKEVICPWIHPVCLIWRSGPMCRLEYPHFTHGFILFVVCLIWCFFVGYSISTVRERNTMYIIKFNRIWNGMIK